MTIRVYLLLDVSYLAYRSYHSTGHLEWEGQPTGVIYGFLRDLLNLTTTFQAAPVFAFDQGESWRKQIYPAYKERRDDGMQEIREAIREQINKLRNNILPVLGYANILAQEGAEADDIVARVVTSWPGEHIIVSADEDYWQLLCGERVTVWNPNGGEMMTEAKFKERFGLEPYRWASVKAIAGCRSDNVIGIDGVGVVTAAKYLNKQLKKTSVKYDAIRRSVTTVLENNLPLVTLPHPNTQQFKAMEDDCSPEKWRRTLTRLGMNSLLRKVV